MARAPKKGMILGDRLTHASVFKLSGSQALCGAGRITLTIPDRFALDDPSACPRCAAQLRARGDFR